MSDTIFVKIMTHDNICFLIRADYIREIVVYSEEVAEGNNPYICIYFINSNNHDGRKIYFESDEEQNKTVTTILDAINGKISSCEKDIKDATFKNLVKVIETAVKSGDIEDKSLERFK